MKKNFVREKLQRGEPTIGTWLTLPDATAARMMAGTGLDWLTIELEHSPVTFETAAQSFAVIAGGGAVPLARVPWNTGENIKRVLDTGAWGVVVPLVNSRAEAEAAVAAARYAPAGVRTIGGQLHAIGFGAESATYYREANKEILVVIMIEQIRGVEAAEEILSVPGIDAVFIGPNDLHHSMGLPPAFDSQEPAYVEAIRHVTTVARKFKVPSGIHVIDAATAKRRIDEGFQFIAISSEAAMMVSKAREIAQFLGFKGGASFKY